MQDAWHPSFAHIGIINVFKETLGLIDGGYGRIDTVAFLERITPAFTRFTHALPPRTIVFAKQTKGKRVEDVYHLFARGMTAAGRMRYRAVRLEHNGALSAFDMDMLDIRRQMLNAYTHRDKPLNHTDMRMRQLLGEQYAQRRIAQDDIGFVLDADADAYRDFDTLIGTCADAMIQALGELVPADARETRNYLHMQLSDALRVYAQDHAQQDRTALQKLAGALRADVRAALATMPDARSATRYNWLCVPDARYINASASVADFSAPGMFSKMRLEAVQACPMLLLQNHEMLDRVLVQSVDYNTGALDMARVMEVVFSARSQPRIDFYASLRSGDMPADMAERLPVYAAYLEDNQPHIPDPQTYDEWLTLRDVARASTAVAKLTERDSTAVFYDLARNNFPYKAPDILRRHFADASAPRVDDVRLWRNRTAVLPLVLKILGEAGAHGLRIPVRHAFYMAAQDDAPFQDIKRAMPRKLITNIHELYESRKLCNVMLDGVSALEILERAHDFATHQGQSDAQLQKLIFTHRIDEHAQAVVFPRLPAARLSFDYTVSPIANHAELIKICRMARSTLMYDGVDAIAENAHFVSISRKGGHVLAIAKLIEPEGPYGAWRVDTVEGIHSKHSNLPQLESLIEEYVDSPAFRDTVRLDTLQAERRQTYTKLAGQAKDQDMTLVDPANIEEKTALLQRYKPYILAKGGWEVDDLGCISNPHIDACVRQMITRVQPFYTARAAPV